jgi:hypothetical protein
MRLLPYTIWNQFFFGDIFLHLGEFFSKQHKKKRKEKEKKE